MLIYLVTMVLIHTVLIPVYIPNTLIIRIIIFLAMYNLIRVTMIAVNLIHQNIMTIMTIMIRAVNYCQVAHHQLHHHRLHTKGVSVNQIITCKYSNSIQNLRQLISIYWYVSLVNSVHFSMMNWGELAFNFLGVDTDGCRRRFVCELDMRVKQNMMTRMLYSLVK